MGMDRSVSPIGVRELSEAKVWIVKDVTPADEAQVRLVCCIQVLSIKVFSRSRPSWMK